MPNEITMAVSANAWGSGSAGVPVGADERHAASPDPAGGTSRVVAAWPSSTNPRAMRTMPRCMTR